jgi:hypothetical protein
MGVRETAVSPLRAAARKISNRELATKQLDVPLSWTCTYGKTH